jgi:hypothetical protein
VEQECEPVRTSTGAAVCFGCKRQAFATLKIEATIGMTRLKMSEHAEQAAVCAVCVLELAKWFGVGDQVDLGAIAGGLVEGTAVGVVDSPAWGAILLFRFLTQTSTRTS